MARLKLTFKLRACGMSFSLLPSETMTCQKITGYEEVLRDLLAQDEVAVCAGRDQLSLLLLSAI